MGAVCHSYSRHVFFFKMMVRTMKNDSFSNQCQHQQNWSQTDPQKRFDPESKSGPQGAFFSQSWPHSSSRILRQSAASGLRSHSVKFSALVDLVTCFLSLENRGNGARRPPERMAAFKTSMVPWENCSGWCTALSSDLESPNVSLQILKVSSEGAGSLCVAARACSDRIFLLDKAKELANGSWRLSLPRLALDDKTASLPRSSIKILQTSLTNALSRVPPRHCLGR